MARLQCDYRSNDPSVMIRLNSLKRPKGMVQKNGESYTMSFTKICTSSQLEREILNLESILRYPGNVMRKKSFVFLRKVRVSSSFHNIATFSIQTYRNS